MDLFISNLKIAIKSDGLLHRDIYERAGMSQCVFSHLLNHAKNTTICTAESIAEAIGYSLAEMLSSDFKPRGEKKKNRETVAA